ncbi:PAS domain S-box protein [Halorussus salinisoli]|uniref:PAS domain S-box protein n=1 Tax=Halorussus salinisoli TaxID=2558242 RepID=UPI0010C16AA1|nr:PAS domain S-box protein [Halorussus salinisoli]
MDAADPLADTLAVFDRGTSPSAPYTTNEVADALDCSRRTAYNRLERLVERGDLETKKVGARGRVWWRPPGESSGVTAVEGAVTDSTDQKPTEDELRESRWRFRSLVEAVDEYAIFRLDPEGRVVSWNQGAERIKGYDREEIVGDHVSTFYTDEDAAAGVPEKNLADAADRGTVEDQGWRIRADGSRFWADVTITAIHDAGELVGYAKVTRDMTEDRYAEVERKLLYSTTRSIAAAETFEGGLRATLQEVCEATDWEFGEAWVPDGDGPLERASADYVEREDLEPFAAASESFTFERGEGLPGRVWASGEPEWMRDVTDYSAATAPRVRQADRFGIESALGVPITTDEGVVAVLVLGMTDSRSADERMVELLSSVCTELGELIERQRAATALDRETELTERILEASQTGISVFSADGNVVRSNRRMADVVGVPFDEMERYTAGEREMTNRDGETVRLEEKPVREVFETGESVVRREVRIELPDGEPRWVSVTAVPLEDDEGELERVVATANDVTRLKEQTRRLERQREDLRRELDDVFERVDDAFYALDDDWRFTYLNDRAETMLESLDIDPLGRRIWDVIPESVEPTLREQYERAMATQTKTDFEIFSEPLDAWLEFHLYPSESGLSVYFRDVTERKERERELEQYERIVETVEDGVYVVNDDREFVLVNDAYAEMVGYDREELLGSPVSLVADDEGLETGREIERKLESDGDDLTTAEADLRTADGERVPTEATFSHLPADDGTHRVGVVRDVTERRQFEETLKALHDSSRQLLGAGSKAEVGDVVVGAATDVLNLSGVLVYRYDDDAGRLRPAEQSVEADVMREDFPEIPADDSSITGTTFADGDPAHYDDICTVPNLSVDPADTEMRAGSFAPMGDHGILVVGSNEVGELDPRTRQLVELLAANAEAAYDRVGREEQLVRHREQLTALNNLNAVVRDINEALVQQSTREQVEQVVCDRLADSDSYAFAWFGEVDPRAETVTLGAEAGVEGYLDDVTISVDPDDETARGPTGRAVETREIQVTTDCLNDPDFAPWREQAKEHGFRSSAAIPVVYENTLYGVLGVYADRVGAFEGEERRVVSQLGEVVGHAIASIERKRALMSDEVVELEFRIRDLFETVGLPETEGAISFDRTVPVGDGEFVVYGTATGDAMETLTALTDRLPHWEDVSVIREEFGTTTFEARLSEPPVVSVVTSNGGYIDEATIEDDYHMTLHFPPAVDVRNVVERIRDAYPTVEVVTRRQVSRSGESLRRLDEVLADEMTDRQRNALEAAYFAGFFEWPRASSAQEVADSLDVADATFHQHVRLAEEKLLSALFEEPASGLR